MTRTGISLACEVSTGDGEAVIRTHSALGAGLLDERGQGYGLQNLQCALGSIPAYRAPKQNEKAPQMWCFRFGDPYGNRTHVTAVKGPCLNLLTNGPEKNVEAEVGFDILVADVGFEPTTCRV